MEKFKFISKNGVSQLPKNPGVYCFKKGREILYIGKAVNIRERVKNHFPSRNEGERRTNVLRTLQPGFQDNFFINKIRQIGFISTQSEIEALILEATLIKKYQPKYNIVWRDDKNYFFAAITKEDFPRIFITHQPKLQTTNYKLQTKYVGPFVDGKALKQTLRVLRRAFPYRSCRVLPNQSCLWYHLNRCPAPCLLKSKTAQQIPAFQSKMKKECQQNAKNLIKILQGKKKQVLQDLKREMKKLSLAKDFERAAKIRDQIKAFEKVLAHAKIFEPSIIQIIPWCKMYNRVKVELRKILKVKNKISRIEAYDISNIQGQLATGSMVIFINGQPAKNFYRRFKIKIAGKPNDIAMIKEVLSRRLSHPEWPFPDLILIDGGKAQLNTTREVLNQYKSAKSALISVLALAKKENKLFIEGRKKPILLKTLPREIFNLILQLRDEAHRFALGYHKKLREVDLRKGL